MHFKLNDCIGDMSVFPLSPKLTVELGVLVPYPEEGREAKDHLRPSALRKKQKKDRSGKGRTYVRIKNNKNSFLYHFQQPELQCQFLF